MARPATALGILPDATWFGTTPSSRLNHHFDSAVRMRPLSGIGVGSTQSNAEMRSLATNSSRSSGVR